MDYRISRASVQGMDDSELFWALIEPLWPTQRVLDELCHLAAATPGQQALYTVTLFIREVDNGGLTQFFKNSSGIYTEAVRDGLRLLAADQHAAAFEAAIAFFPHGRVPVDRDARSNAVQAIIDERGKKAFRDLDKQLFGERRLWPFFRSYVEAHPEDFFFD